MARRLVLRGSILMKSWIPKARPPVDVDYLADGALDAPSLETFAREVAEQADKRRTRLAFFAARATWIETASPGLKVTLVGRVASDPLEKLEMDFGTGNPL